MAYGVRDKYNNMRIRLIFSYDKRLSDYLFQIIVNSMINFSIVKNHQTV